MNWARQIQANPTSMVCENTLKSLKYLGQPKLDSLTCSFTHDLIRTSEAATKLRWLRERREVAHSLDPRNPWMHPGNWTNIIRVLVSPKSPNDVVSQHMAFGLFVHLCRLAFADHRLDPGMTRFYCIYKFGVPDRPSSSIPFSTTLLLFQCLVWYHFHNSMAMKVCCLFDIAFCFWVCSVFFEE